MKNVQAAQSISYDEFNRQVKDVIKNDNYSSISVEKDVTYTELIDVLNVDFEPINTYSTNNADKNLLPDDVETICEDFGFNVKTTKTEYNIYSKFQLKRLIVLGEVKNTYNACNVISGYKDYNILSYETEEETEYAFNQLIKDENLNVTIDTILTLHEEETENNITPTATRSYKTWGASYINVDQYRDYIGTTNQSIVVAVVDTGINTSHEKFTNRFLYDSNGKIVGSSQYNSSYTYSGYKFEDDDGHGTHVAGTICELTPQNVKILPVKIFNGNGDGTSLTATNGLEYVLNLSTTYKFTAVNMSFGAETTNDSEYFKGVFAEIFTRMRNKNILPVSSAGNKSADAGYYWPGSAENSITVSALKSTTSGLAFDNSYSNYGSVIDISAPGTAINSAAIASSNSKCTNGYTLKSGTSMAAPHVTAVVTLLCLDPIYWNENLANYTADVIEKRLYDSAEDLGTAGKDIYYGHGALSLKNFRGNILHEVNDAECTYDGNYHNISVTVKNLNSYSIYYGVSMGNIVYTNIDNVALNNKFKNVQDNPLTVYYKITTTESGYLTTIGSATLTILPREIEVTINNASSQYGDDISNFTYNVTKGGLATGDTLQDLSLNITTTATKQSGVGLYDVTANSSNKNYDIDYIYNKYQIVPAIVTVAISNKSGTYGEEPSLMGVTSTCDQLKNGDTIQDLNLTYTISGITNKTSVGAYSNRISASYNNPNYSITFDLGDYIVTQRYLRIKLLQTDVYGTEHIITSNYTILSGNIVNSDNLGLKFALDGVIKTSPVGQYNINVTYSNLNYNVDVESAILKITKKSASITILDDTSVYGEQVVINHNAYTSTGVVEGDNLGVLLTIKNLTSNVGEYVISGSYTNSNYDITFVDGTYTITPLKIKISTAQESEYGDNVVLDNNDYDIQAGYALANSTDDLCLNFTTLATKGSPVGVYDIEMTYSNKNYEVVLTSGVYTIKTKNLKVVINDITSVYGENIKSLTCSIYHNSIDVSLENHFNFNIALTCDVTKESKVGNYDIVGENKNLNYNITFVNGTYTVTEREIKIVLNNRTSEYGDDIVELTYEIENGSIPSFASIDELNLLIKTTATKTSSVGNYPITATYTNENYNLIIVDGTYTISRRQITISTSQASLYGQDIVLDNEKYIIEKGTLVETDKNLGITFSTTATNSSVIGQYPITMTYTNTNYQVVLSRGVYKIVEKIIEITIGNKTTTYGDELSLSDVLVEVEDNSVTLEELNITLISNALTEKLVGNYDILAECGNENFSISFTPGVYTIAKRIITITSVQSGTYGNVPRLTNTYSIVQGTVLNNDELGIQLATEAVKESDVGSYNISISNVDNLNYQVEIVNSVYKVEQREFTIKIDDKSSVFGDNIVPLTYTFVSGSLAPFHNITNVGITLSTTANIYSPVVASGYPITMTYTNKNYKINFNVGNYKIEKRLLKITTEQSSIYGEDIVIDNAKFTIVEGEVMPFNSNLEITFSTNATKESPVGTYDIIMISTNPNYKIVLTKGVYKILTKTIHITIGDKTITYGEDVDLSNISITAVEENIDIDDIQIQLNSQATSKKIVGEYDINATYLNKSYEVEFIPGKFTILKRVLKIKSEQSVFYGNSIIIDNKNYVITEGSIVKNDVLNITLRTDAKRLDNVGEYDIELVSYDNTNYEVILQKGTLTITKRELIIVIHDKTSVYGDDIVELTYEIKFGYALATGNSINDLNIVVSTSATNISKVQDGGYTISAIYNNENYNVTFENGIYIITPKTIHISIENKTGEYGQDIQDLTCLLHDALVGEDIVEDLNIQLSTFATKTSDVIRNGYPITGSFENNNYIVEFTEGVYLINPKEIKIELKNQQGQYGDNIRLNNNDYIIITQTDYTKEDIKVILSTTAKKDSDIGKYKITASCQNKNFTISYEEGIYQINKRKIVIKMNDIEVKRYFEFDVSNCGYEVVEGSIADVGVFEIKPKTNANWISFGGEYYITATCNNKNYDLKVINGNVNMVTSATDVGVIVFITGLFATVIIAIFMNKTRRNKEQKRFEDLYQEIRRKN